MQLHLICNGMMGLWYRPAQDGKPDGYRVYIPQPPVYDGMQQHQLRIGTSLGAPDSVLNYPPECEPTKFFELQFGYGPSVKTRCMKAGDNNLLIYGKDGRKVYPSLNEHWPAGVAYVIDIPYPDAEQSVRHESYSPVRYPYEATGCCVSDFDLHPRRIPRGNVYTFGIVNPELSVTLQNQKHDHDRRFLRHGPITNDVKVYIYNGPPHFMSGMKSHLPVFNGMFRYNGQPLDLTRATGAFASCTPLDSIVPPDGLTRDDLKHLCEINDKMDFYQWLHSQPKLSEDERRPVLMFTDPAECVIGGGC